ncbi:short chain dehydrogenase [Bimuria novae-zelandiae CBS 107.79]|uniref:Short chain dehydrogenase n=1 Tax=Bimuria novae-zelandiae CBS 107.79 TaxID=1447943 RepID=A0A6A5VSW1_9PLEO|nr:short chain dehydrogenase [Bimuria novae-zelandiae CBS 107.79]
MTTVSTSAPLARPHEGKLAIITGASRSIGAAIARNLAAKGSNVVIVYLTENSDPLAAKLAQELNSTHGVVAIPVRADFTTAEGVQKIIHEAKKKAPINPKTGKFQVDILVHSAALFHAMPLEACNFEDFQKVYAINVWGPINLTQAVKQYLPTDRSGRIVNVSSVGSKVGLQYLTIYGGSKGALEAMTRTWARELAEQATVNCINPGSTMTDMYRDANPAAKEANALFNPLVPLSPLREWDTEEQRKFGEMYGGRVAYPEEIAGIVGMICSPESAWMTGCLVSANGGQWMSS